MKHTAIKFQLVLLISTGLQILTNSIGFSQDKESFLEHYKGRRIVVIMFDGFGMSYYKNSELPEIKGLLGTGFFKEVNAMMPTVTNCNNTAICCGNFPKENGISGNTYLTPEGKEEYMEDGHLLLSPTLFEKLQKHKLKSAIVSSKKKSITLLSAGTEIAVSAESPDSQWVKILGKAPDIYSPEINYWTMRAGIYILKNRKDITCVYLHTTDYPMHAWSPQDSNSIKHISKIDQYIGEIAKIAPDALILITADHDINHKSQCVDLEKSLALQNVSIKIAISAERDKYFKHHRGFGGASYVYLNKKEDADAVKTALLKIKGIKTVLTNKEFSEKYHQITERTGDLIALADSSTVFGNLESPNEKLPETYRSHGSEYEIRVPLFILNANKLPPASFFNYNKDLIPWLIQ